jgi:hypothetical protein
MNQLLRELIQASERLDPHKDRKLVEYLCGEVQHLINRIESGRALDEDEQEELELRRSTVKAFINFYSIYLLNTL